MECEGHVGGCLKLQPLTAAKGTQDLTIYSCHWTTTSEARRVGLPLLNEFFTLKSFLHRFRCAFSSFIFVLQSDFSQLHSKSCGDSGAVKQQVEMTTTASCSHDPARMLSWTCGRFSQYLRQQGSLTASKATEQPS